VFLVFPPALRGDLDHKATLLRAATSLPWVRFVGRQGDVMRHFVWCNSNRRSLSRDVFEIGHLLDEPEIM